MKKIFVLLIFIVFVITAGCSIKEQDVKTNDTKLAYMDEINILLTKDAVPYIEQLGFEFQKDRKDIKLNFIRVDDDINYRSRVFDAIDSDKVCAFYVHGFKDASFFKYLIKSFDIEKYKDKALIFDGAFAFKVGFYISGLWANLNILHKYGIDETKITSTKRLKEFLNILKEKFKLSKKNLLPKNSDIYSLVCSVGFSDGDISSYFNDMLNLIYKNYYFADKENVNKLLFSGHSVFYYGSSRDLDPYLLKKSSGFVRCLPIGFGNELFNIVEEDYFCISNKNTDEKTDIILQFFNFVSSKLYELIGDGQNIKISEAKNMPFGFRKVVLDQTKDFFEGKKSFEDIKFKIKSGFKRCSLFDRSF